MTSPEAGAELTMSASALAVARTRKAVTGRSTASFTTAQPKRAYTKRGTPGSASPRALRPAARRSTHAERITELPAMRMLAEGLGRPGKCQAIRQALRDALALYEHEKRRADLLAAAVDCFLAGERR